MEQRRTDAKYMVKGTLIFNDDESYNAYRNGEAGFKNGLRNRDKGTLYRQPDFEENFKDQFPYYDYVDYNNHSEYDKVESTPEQQEMAQIIGEVIVAVAEQVITKYVAPAVKYWWQEIADPSLKKMLKSIIIQGKKSIPSKKGIQTKAQRILQENKKKSTVTFSNNPTEIFYQELDKAYNNYATNMTSEEAQRELLEIFILSAMVAAKTKKLSNANIVQEEAMVCKLTSSKYITGINQILESNTLLLKEKSVTLSQILGCNIVTNGQFNPITNSHIKESLIMK